MAESNYLSAFNQNCVQGEIPRTTPENTILPDMEFNLLPSGEPLKPPPAFIIEVKKDVKAKVLSEDNQVIFSRQTNRPTDRP